MARGAQGARFASVGARPCQYDKGCYRWTVVLPALASHTVVTAPDEKVCVMPRLERWLDRAKTTKVSYHIRGVGRARIHWDKTFPGSPRISMCTSSIGKVEAITELEYASWYKSKAACEAGKPRHTLGTRQRCAGSR